LAGRELTVAHVQPQNAPKRPPAPHRPQAEDDPPLGAQLAACLWVIAVMLAIIEIVWWMSNRIFSP
jgi:hypothetical protein